MKRTLLSLTLVVFVLAGLAQPSLLKITGRIINDSTGAPVPFHAVLIQGDSATGNCPNGMVFSQIVKTNPNGYYFRNIPLHPGSPASFTVSTKDCNQTVHAVTIPAVAGMDTVNFSICHNLMPPPPPGNCHAQFTTRQYPQMPLKVKFISKSVPLSAAHSWDFGDGSTSNLKHPIHQYTAPGSYTVCLMIQTANGLCGDTICHTILVDTIAPPPPAPCQASFLTKKHPAIPYQVKFVSKSTPFKVQHNWNFGDGTTSQVRHPLHVYTAPGLYNVCLTISDSLGICTDTFCMNVLIDSVVAPPPTSCQANFSYAIHPVTGAVHFTDMSTPAIHYTHWSFGDGTGSNLKNPVHAYNAPGTYNVRLAIGCMNPAFSCVDTIIQAVVIPVAKTANVSNTPAKPLGQVGQVYPNPSSTEAFIDMEVMEAGRITLQVMDLSGRKVYETSNQMDPGAQSISIPTDRLTSGYYTLRIYHQNGDTVVRKFNRVE